MARINLLPWREQRREERKREFIALSMAVVVVAAALVVVSDRALHADIIYQRARNDFLRREISTLDARIAQISALQEQRQQINSRMRVIQELQGSRSNAVRVFDALVRALPSGVYFNALQRSAERLQIDGGAESNNKVSELMRRLDASACFVNPVLQQISAARSATSSQQAAANTFSLLLFLQAAARAQE